MVVVVTCIAPVNIAVIKYWGKRDEKLILPINDSISITLSSDHMRATTSVAASPDFKSDRIWLNGVEETVEGNQRLLNCLEEVRKRAGRSKVDPCWKVHINSRNNFPTAAGLASSAAGYACLVYALCNLYGVEGDISSLARQGSGSACRSVYGGFVRWHMGSDPAGKDSIAKVIQPREFWPEMRCLILVANDRRKKVPSSKGMKLGVETSEFLKFRAEVIVPDRTEKMVEAINTKNFKAFAELTIKDSNSLHAVCLDTYPPCVYMNSVSHAAADLVHLINNEVEEDGNMVAAYTFDAGPNCCIFLLEKHFETVLKIFEHFFPKDEGNQDYVMGNYSEHCSDQQDLMSKLEKAGATVQPKGSLKYIICTGVGSGPKVLQDGHLLDQQSGLPV